MSAPFDLQLREYTEFFDSQLPVVDLDEIVRGRVAVESAEADVCESCGTELTVFDLREPVESPVPAPRKRRAAVLAVAAAILLVAGVVVVADQTGSDVVTGPVSSVASPDAVPSPDVADPVPPGVVGDPVDLLGYRWSRVPQNNAVFGDAEFASVIVGGPGLVAVGSVESSAAVWTSVDGITWTRVPHDEVVFGGEGAQRMSSVTAGGPGLVAVGSASDGSDSAGEDGGDAAVWTSIDGLTWTRVPHDEAVFGGVDVQQMFDVATVGSGLVAVGYDGEGAPYENPDQHAAVWTSVDGITWTRVPHDEAVFGGEGARWMNSVTAGGPGLVAVGLASDGSDSAVEDGGDADAAVWTSIDGLTWTRVPHDEAVFGDGDGSNGLELQRMNSVIVGGPGLVAVGFAPTPNQGAAFTTDAAVWTSIDGLNWTRVPHDETVFGGFGDQEMFDVTTVGSGLVAVGHAGGRPEQQAAVWTSADGVSWARVPHDDTVFGGWISALTPWGAGVVAVGWADVGEDFEPAAVWVATPEN